MFPSDCYGPHKLALMERAFNAAWHEVEDTAPSEEKERTALRTMMALRIMAAVRDGEWDLGCLTRVALIGAFVFR